MSQTENSEDLELFHYGVKGMQWGVKRRVGSDGLVARAKAGKQASNDRMIKAHTNLKNRTAGKVGNALSAPDRMLLGKKRFEKFHDKRINRLEKQNERISKGKMTVLDKFDVALNTSVLDMVFEEK